MQLHVIHTGNFKLDGGAMFGVVPKVIWNKLNPADEHNLCTWAMRCLLIEDGKKLILIDTGIGEKQDEKFFSHYYLHNTKTLAQALHEKGYSCNDVTDVILTHLHFDHCGGAVSKNTQNTGYEPVFKNAVYWSNPLHWEWATKPNAREKASFLKENILPIKESGQLTFIDETNHNTLFEKLSFIFVNGHTEHMMLPIIEYKGQKIIYMADLIPSVAHLPVPYVMGYDTRPLLTLQEKEQILSQAQQQGAVLFFEHDPIYECCTLMQTEKGIRAEKTMRLEEII